MVKWTPKSENDLKEMAEHIAKNFNVDLAIQVITELIDHVESLLNQNPKAGSLLESNPLFSKIIFKGNSIFYCIHNKDIYIVYVQNRKSNLKKDRLKNIKP